MNEPQTIAQALRDALGAVIREQWSGTRTQMGALTLLADAATLAAEYLHSVPEPAGTDEAAT